MNIMNAVVDMAMQVDKPWSGYLVAGINYLMALLWWNIFGYCGNLVSAYSYVQLINYVLCRVYHPPTFNQQVIHEQIPFRVWYVTKTIPQQIIPVKCSPAILAFTICYLNVKLYASGERNIIRCVRIVPGTIVRRHLS